MILPFEKIVAETETNLENEELFLQKGFYRDATISLLNKITTRRLETYVGVTKPVKFGNLLISIKGCWIGNTGPLDTEESRSFVTIWENKPREIPKIIFEGWLWSSGSELSTLEHPIYDIALLQCKSNNVEG